MRKAFNLILMMLLFVACSDHDEPIVNVKNDIKISNLRSIDDAISIAESYINHGSETSRSGVKINRNGVHFILKDQSRSAGADTLMYAIDFENDNGFMLVAAPKNVEPIMAVIETGAYSDVSNNIAYNNTIDNIKNYISINSNNVLIDTIGGRLPIITDVLCYYDSVNVNRVQTPVVEVAWGQNWPECMFTPNDCAGCVPVAIAHMCSAFEIPNSINYTYEGRDLDTEHISWPLIKKHKRSYPDSYSYIQACKECSHFLFSHTSLARVMRQIGQIAECNYTYFTDPYFGIQKGATGTDYENIQSTVYKMLGKIPMSQGSHYENLFRDIDGYKGIAIVVAGDLKSPGNGHAWLADATQFVYHRISYYEYDEESKSYFLINEKILKDIKLIHFNWGYGGEFNGWFNVKAISNTSKVVTDQGEEYDYTDIDNAYQPETYLGIQYLFYKKS